MSVSSREHQQSDLLVFPRQVVFPLVLHRDSHVAIYLKNLSVKRLAFKVLTTSPSRYSVYPCNGILTHKDTAILTVTMRRFHHVPSRLGCCVDKFLIKSIEVEDSLTDFSPRLFTNNDRVFENRVEAWVDDIGSESVTDFSSKLSGRSTPFNLDSKHTDEMVGDDIGKLSVREQRELKKIIELRRAIPSDHKEQSAVNLNEGIVSLERRLHHLESQHRKISRSRSVKEKKKGRWGSLISSGLTFIVGYLTHQFLVQ